ncbi:MAG: 4Fe-4S binding protein [Nitrospirota bacterium]|jgi:epoxyqueuosine reductase
MSFPELKNRLIEEGATVVGYARVDEALMGEIGHLSRAVSVGVDRKLNSDTLRLLGALQKTTERFLRERGYRFLSIPPDSDRINDTFVSKLYSLFSHKVAATCAGIGWVGKNGLLISPVYGPRLSLVTVLTDAALKADGPIERSRCGQCRLCVELCPSGAVSGEEWSRDNPFPDLIDYAACSAHKESIRSLSGKPNCGFCINICPYGRRQPKEDPRTIVVTVEDGE